MENTTGPRFAAPFFDIRNFLRSATFFLSRLYLGQKARQRRKKLKFERKITMKKLIMIVTLCTAVALMFMACVSTDSPLSTTVQIPSPVTDCQTLEEAAGITGFSMSVPEALDGYDIRQISTVAEKMIQVNYHNGDADICMRKAAEGGDISGDYNTYSQERTVDVDGIRVTMKGNGDLVSLVLWTAEGYSYSVGIYGSDGISEEAAADLVGQIQ